MLSNAIASLTVRRARREHAIVMAVGDQEPTAVDLHRVLQSVGKVEGSLGWIVPGELADVGDDVMVRTIDTVDADVCAAQDIGAHQRHQRVRGVPMKATSIAPPMPMIDSGRPLANVVTAPVLRSTREIRPTAPSVT